MDKGDLLVVKLMDVTYKVYFKGKAHVGVKKEMEDLREQLVAKGVKL